MALKSGINVALHYKGLSVTFDLEAEGNAVFAGMFTQVFGKLHHLTPDRRFDKDIFG